MKHFLFLFLLTLSAHAQGQVLDNRNGEAFTDQPFFNTEFIRKNKLKRLNGTYTYMKRGDVMRETNFKYVYEFDSLGNLSSTYETRDDDGSKDTTWNFYIYDEQGYLMTHRKTDMDGFATIHYTRDSIGRVMAEEQVREIDTLNHQIIRTISFNKERFEYKNYDLQEKRTRYNNYNLAYLDEFWNYNELGYLVERVERVKMTSAVFTYTYEYNREGKLSAIRKASNKSEGYLDEFEFGYDELGNLQEKKIYRKGEQTTDIQIVYNNQSKLLSSVITKQVSTGFLRILRFRDYEFFD